MLRIIDQSSSKCKLTLPIWKSGVASADKLAGDGARKIIPKNNRGYLSNTSKPRLFYPCPFHGELLPEPFEVGRGSAPPMAGNGPAVRGSSVQGFPCRYYDWRVLDEHFERGFRQRAKQFTQRQSLPSGTDGIKKRRTGGLRIAFLFYQDALRRPPVFPACKAKARRESERGKGEAWIMMVKLFHVKHVVVAHT